MHKSFFAALSAAALLLSPISALAMENMDEMDEVTEAGGPSGIGQGTTTGAVAINEKNFPDAELRKGLLDDTNGQAKNAADVTTIVVGPDVKDLTGLKYCTDATIFVFGATMRDATATIVPNSENSDGGAVKEDDNLASTQDEVNPKNYKTYLYKSNNNISSLDLSPLTKLEGVFIGGFNPGFNSGQNVLNATDAANTVKWGNNALLSVALPETDTLTELRITNNKALPTLDLSPASDLTLIDVSNNNLNTLTVGANKTVTEITAYFNNLYSLDLSACKKLETLNITNNKIYELKVPSSLKELYGAANKLKEFDGSSLENLTYLNLSQNMLESLTLPTVGTILYLNVDKNHLASLDAEEAMDLSSTFGFTGKDQTIYVNEETEAINLLDYDPNYEYKKAFPGNAVGGNADANGVYQDLLVNGTATTADKYSGKKDNILTLENGTASYTYNAIGKLPYTGNFSVTIKEADLMNRLYNPNSGEHFYTKDLNEKDVLVKLGWEAEGIGWVAPMASEVTPAIPVYRLYNPNAGDHHYTKDVNERDTLVRVGWDNEGIGWYSAQEARPDYGINSSIEVYREYNPNAKAAGAHNYTINPIENETLISIGWIDEGIAWWANK